MNSADFRFKCDLFPSLISQMLVLKESESESEESEEMEESEESESEGIGW